jgi:hypothetical protein
MSTLKQRVLQIHSERPTFKYAEVLGDGIIAAVEEHQGYLATVVYFDNNLWESTQEFILPDYLQDRDLGVAAVHLRPQEAISLARERLIYKHLQAIWFDDDEEVTYH